MLQFLINSQEELFNINILHNLCQLAGKRIGIYLYISAQNVPIICHSGRKLVKAAQHVNHFHPKNPNC